MDTPRLAADRLTSYQLWERRLRLERDAAQLHDQEYRADRIREDHHDARAVTIHAETLAEGPDRASRVTPHAAGVVAACRKKRQGAAIARHGTDASDPVDGTRGAVTELTVRVVSMVIVITVMPCPRSGRHGVPVI